MKKRALILGIAGMDGSHLADFLLAKNYDVFGIDSSSNKTNIEHISSDINLLQGNLSDKKSICDAIYYSSPDEIYNLAAFGIGVTSWESPEICGDITGLGALRILEAIKDQKKNIKFFHASSSEIFGKTMYEIVTEDTPMNPITPYGSAKLYSHCIVKNYREKYGMFNCLGILFNHESERKSVEYVIRKITHNLAKIVLGKSDSIILGNLDAEKDWGYAPDYVEAMYLMLQHDIPDDYIIATGKKITINQILDIAFNSVEIQDWRKYIKIDPKYIRPKETNYNCGSIKKIKFQLGWTPRTSINDWIKKMINYDINILKEKGCI